MKTPKLTQRKLAHWIERARKAEIRVRELTVPNEVRSLRANAMFDYILFLEGEIDQFIAQLPEEQRTGRSDVLKNYRTNNLFRDA